MNLETAIPLRKRITFRILITTMIGLAMTLASIAYTLLLSWQLEGGGAAINEAGSLRMRSYRIAAQLSYPTTNATIENELTEFNRILSELKNGDPQRPLFLPTTGKIRAQIAQVEQEWKSHKEPLILKIVETQEPFQRNVHLRKYAQGLPVFVGKINQLVSDVEIELSEKTTWLRLCQTALIFMSLAASVAILYLLYLWIVGPVGRLHAGIARMSKDDLSVRLPVESDNEFGVLANAFNTMADHVQTAHRTLGERVREKTAKLQEQNEEISTLYEIAEFLAGPHAIEELCRGFLQRIMHRVGADGGTVRILDIDTKMLHITVHEGISESLIEKEHCIRTNDCLCGAATQQGIILVRDFRELSKQKTYMCKEEGYTSLAVFQIQAREEVIGSFSLHFNREKEVTSEEYRLLETLGKNLGSAIENLRLIASQKEFAVSQERNLLAQGLHDSIAQGLNFLNLQVQMLEDAIAREDMSELSDIAPLLRAGVQESYEDVRELLLNFRTRLQEGNLESEMRNVLARFERQTQLQTHIEIIGNGAKLAPEQQLQVLFILQEALSNVRKHAQATKVSVRVENDRDFSMKVQDDGVGFSLLHAHEKGENHVGLGIMQERAVRLGAKFEIQSQVGQGTLLSLHLLRQERMVA
jgi:two-component system nitrate/nitrite sensor histidine kinase NarX